jgi:hypothetical protein
MAQQRECTPTNCNETARCVESSICIPVIPSPQLNIEVLEAPRLLMRGEIGKLKINLTNEQNASVTGAEVAAVSDFFDKTLLDDAKHDDGAAGDGVYGSTFTVLDYVKGMKKIKFVAEKGGMKAEKIITSWG